MTDEIEKQMEATRIWDHPQFLVADVCKITGATPKALEHFVNPERGLVPLVGPYVNPGTGRRRIFTGSQVLMIAAVYSMNRIGFPQRFSKTLARMVERRAYAKTAGATSQSGLKILTYPMANGDWAVVPFYNEQVDAPLVPVATQILDVDRLVDEVRSQLVAIVADEDVPDFSVPEPKPEPSPFSPASNFFRSWERSDDNRWTYVGLTKEETDELLALQGFELDGDDLRDVDPLSDRDPESRDRYLELFQKHENERLKRCGA